ncbi:MAG: PAS domain S-box protein, partial [Anaerolineae bacterium]|nr:PAS domain S-box protein [Anaerolineae bacterium]
YKQVMDTKIALKEGWNLEYQIITRTGKVVYVHELGGPGFDEHGIFVRSIGTLQDITESKLVEEKLLKSQALFRQAELMGKIGHWEWDYQDDRMVSCSEQFARIYEMTVDEALKYFSNSKAVVSLVLQEDREWFNQSYQDSLEQRKGHEIEFRLITHSGAIRHIHSVNERVVNDQGEIISGIGTIQDITERVEAEAALKESEVRFQQLAEAVDEVFVISDVKQNSVIYANQAYEQIWGRTLKELYDDSNQWDAAIHPDDLPQTKKAWARLIEHGERYEEEYRVIRPDGSLRWVRSKQTPVLNESGKIYRFAGIVQDITERVQAEKYLSNIINSMPSVLVGVDSDGKITQWNSEAQRATGLLPEQAVGQPLNQAIPRLASEMERVREAMKLRQVRTDPRRAYKEDGQTRYEEITVFPLITNGVEGAVIRVDDITEQVRLEELMIQSEKMLSVGGLAAGMAHEINNPLAGMMQTANVLSNRLSEDLPANEKAAQEAGTSMEAIRAFMESRGIPRMLAAINDSGRRVAEIVDNMLSFARKTDSSISSHNMSKLMDKTLDLAATDYDLRKRYDFKVIEIVKEYEADLPKVLCESAKIQQVFLNILRNGAHAMQDAANNDEEGQRHVKKSRMSIRISHEKESDMLRIEIEDNGRGMDEATRKRVFEPFFTTKSVGVGTGLGLSVSYFIITENHGGRLDVVSEPGKGSNFIIRLPVDFKE